MTAPGGDQTQFIAALLNPKLPTPEGLIDPQGQTAPKRFAVYRNNVATSLTEALITGFPVIYKLVGDEFFRALAGVFLRQHPPSSPLMMHYGEQMPGFLEGFEPVAHLGYLPDVARLELAMRESYHAADSTALPSETLAALAPADLVAARLRLSPALRLVRALWPIHAIWRANMEDNAPKPEMAAENVLITRPGFDPVQTRITDGTAVFITALMAGASLGEAFDQAAQNDGTFDLTQGLLTLLQAEAITGLSEGT